VRPILLCALLAIACMAPTCIPVPGPAPGPDASTVVDGGADAPEANCATACARLGELGCPEAKPSCEPVCRKVLATRLTPFDVACVSRAVNVEAVRTCPAIRCAP
jgi:hypothetical protein